MKLHLSLKTKVRIWVLGALFGPALAFAQPEPEVNDPNVLVEVQLNQDYLANYKTRRENHGIYYGLQYEALTLKNYVSPSTALKYSSQFNDEPIGLIQINMSYKYNMAIGSIALGAAYGMGSVSGNGGGTTDKITLDVTKYGLGLQLTLDMLMDEPYAAPYFGLNFSQMELTEKTLNTSNSVTVDMVYNYTLGVLVQLNWIDSDVAREATFNSGLENTFLDFFITQYGSSEIAAGSNTETDMLYGAGIRLEF